MDRALKERIIGAIILVIFVVLVVPVFLDGPEEAGEVVTERVPLPGQQQQPVKTVILEQDRSEPLPPPVELPAPADDAPVIATGEEPPEDTTQAVAAAAPATDETPPPDDRARGEQDAETEPAAVPETTAPDPETARKPVVSARPATGMFAVQLGSFSNEENANRLAAELRKEGFAAFLGPVQSGSQTLYRVRVGPQKDRPAAEAMAKRLADAGHPGQVVPHL